MSSTLQTPQQFDFTHPETWPEWSRRYQRYRNLNKLQAESEQYQIDNLVYIMGDTAEDILLQLSFANQADRKKYEKVWDAFDKYYQPKTNVMHYVVKFHAREQLTGEANEQFIRELHALAQKCNFGDKLEENIKFRLLAGMTDKNLSLQLQQDAEITLAKVTTRMRDKETLAKQQQERESSVAAIQKCNGARSGQNKSSSTNGYTRSTSANRYTNAKATSSAGGKRQITDCRYCGRNHPVRQCPAYGKVCNKCQKRNHFASKCLQSKARPSSSKEVNEICDDVTDRFCITSIDVDSCDSVWMENIHVNGNSISCKIDTGAQVNVLPLSIFNESCSDVKISETNVVLSAYSGHKIPCVGSAVISFGFLNSSHSAEFFITSNNSYPIIGLPTLKRLGIVGVDSTDTDLLTEFNDIFSGIGKLPGTHKITLKPDHTPVICQSRIVPFPMRDKLKTELDRLEGEHIIVKCSEPSEWLSPIVVVPKPNNAVRVCLDPVYLNQAIMREHFLLPTRSELFANMAGSTVFSTLDATQGFHQLELDAKSSKLTTFLTPFGRYSYRRLPFGIKSASEVWHKAMYDHFHDIEGVEIYLDDLIVHANTRELHDARLRKVFERARAINLRFNKAKCKLGRESVDFVGITVGRDGLKPQESKVQAIRDMTEPKSKVEVQSFLGAVTYLSQFCENLAEHTEPLRACIRKNVIFSWNKPQQEAFSKLKKLVTEAPTLRLFDSKKPVTLSVDSSSHSLGACIMQEGRPVEYAAKSLSDTQKRYAQIEKEMLAVVWGIERFNDYVYGQKFTVQTDHKPLLGLIRKPASTVTRRLQGMLLRLQGYDFELVYVPGKELFIADMLSRYGKHENTKVAVTAPQECVDAMQLVCESVINSSKQAEYIQATNEDRELKALMYQVQNGWPTHKSQCNDLTKSYWNVRMEITSFDGLMFFKDRLIIPWSKRAELLNQLHVGHMGVTKTQQRARQSLYWPGMSRQIEDKISSCAACQENQRTQVKSPLMPLPVPKHPYEIIATDLFHLEGRDYLLVVDCYSKWVDVVELSQSTTSSVVVAALKRLLSERGLCSELHSDNGPQYTSKLFRDFMCTYNIRHVTSSPGFPQSNGQAERMVQTVKQIMRKSGSEWMSGLRSLRNTPLSVNLPSPAQLLMGRTLYEGIPVPEHHLFPRAYDREKVAKEFENLKAVQKSNHDKRAGEEKEVLKDGSQVRVQGQNGKWFAAKVTEKHDTPRSYVVTDQSGNSYRRTRDMIRLTATEQNQTEALGESTVSEAGGQQSPSPTDSNHHASASTTASSSSFHYITRYGRTIHKPKRYNSG